MARPQSLSSQSKEAGEAINWVDAELHFLPDRGVQLIASGEVWLDLPPGATFEDLLGKLQRLGYVTDCPRQYGAPYPTWPRRSYLLECMQPAFSIDLDYSSRLLVDNSASPSRKVQGTTTSVYTPLPDRVLSLEGVRSCLLDLESMRLDKFNSRPAKDALFHCCYSLQRHLLPFERDERAGPAIEHLVTVMGDLPLLRAADRLSKAQRDEYMALLRKTLALCSQLGKDSRAPGVEAKLPPAAGAGSESSEEDAGSGESAEEFDVDETASLLSEISLRFGGDSGQKPSGRRR